MYHKIKKSIKTKLISRLSLQLVFSFLGMFIIVVFIALSVLYVGIVKILENKTENYSIARFRQCEYNINSFCNDIDLISRQLVINAQLQNLTGYSEMSKADQIYYAALILKNFTSILGNYTFIDSIGFYGADGLIIKSTGSGNYMQYNASSLNDWFYKTREYQKSKEKGQKLIWFGGYTNRDFLSASVNKAKPVKYYITTARDTLSIGYSGMLLMNIDMHYFTSVFNNSYNESTGSIYLIDDSGKVISGLDEYTPGEKSSIYDGIDKKKKYDSFTAVDKGEKKQVIYYKLSDFDGILVNEVPFNTITKDAKTLRYILVILFFISIVIAFILSKFWIYKLLDPLKKLVEVIKKVGQGNLGLTIVETSENELGILSQHFNDMSLSIKDLFDRNEANEAEKRSLEIEALRWQINPHFIYNTLNTIKWMAVINNEENIVDSVTTLSNCLEPIFRKRDIMCTVKDEIEYIENYIKIMNYRFAGGFKCIINIPEELMDVRIIRFVLQPIVENSIMHGLINKVKGEISIMAWKQDQNLWVQVEDDGEGMSESMLEDVRQSLNDDRKTCTSSGHGIGLSNVNRRIRLHFGKEFGLEIHSQSGKGTSVLFKMPITK